MDDEGNFVATFWAKYTLYYDDTNGWCKEGEAPGEPIKTSLY